MMKVTNETSATSNDVKLIWDSRKSRIHIVNVFIEWPGLTKQLKAAHEEEIQWNLFNQREIFLWASLPIILFTFMFNSTSHTADCGYSLFRFSRTSSHFYLIVPYFFFLQQFYAACESSKQLCQRFTCFYASFYRNWDFHFNCFSSRMDDDSSSASFIHQSSTSRDVDYQNTSTQVELWHRLIFILFNVCMPR